MVAKSQPPVQVRRLRARLVGPWQKSEALVVAKRPCPTFGGWDTASETRKFPPSLTELHVTFAYTSPPPTPIHNAPRGTFFPPPSRGELPLDCWFDTVRRLVVRDANADFVAFLTTACPRLEQIASTAEFGVEDVPDDVLPVVKNRLVFVRLPRTTKWPGLTAADTKPLPKRFPQTFAELRALSPRWDPNTPPIPKTPV